MKTRLIVVVVSFLTIITAIACDDGGKSKKDMTPDEYMEYLINEYVNNFCDYAIRCPENSDIEFQNVTECRSILGSFVFLFMGPEILWAMDNGAKPNPDKLDECIQTFSNSSCDQNRDAVPACRQILTGTIPTGQPCSVGWQCVSGFCNTSDSCPGVCADTKAAGASCETDEECNLGLECNEDNKCGQPAARKDQGDACEWDGQCKYGLYCLINDYQNYTGTCQPWLDENDTCESENQELECRPGLGCNSETGKCQKVVIVGEGQACDNEINVCSFSQNLICGGGSCIKLPQNGEPCLQQYCWFGNYCGEDNQCHTIKEYGDTCTTNQECSTELCDSQSHVCIYDPCNSEVDY
mgnify:CR=1 FL=1